MDNRCMVLWRDVPTLQNNMLFFLHALEDQEELSFFVVNEDNFTKKDHELLSVFNKYEIYPINSLIQKNLLSIIKNIKTFIKGVFIFIKFIIFFLSNQPVSALRINVNGLDIGNLIYDTYIRQNNNYRNIFKNSFQLYKVILVAIVKCNLIIRLIYKKKPKYIVCTTSAYISFSGIALKAANFFEIKAFEISASPKKYFTKDHFQFSNKFISEDILNQTTRIPNWSDELEGYFRNLFITNGKAMGSSIFNFDLDNAYLKKQNIDASEVKNLILGKGKKSNFNVVVASHVFSDAPNSTYNQIYRDYFSWFIETLKIIRTIDSVNWIFKPHPSRDFYNEGDVFDTYFFKYKLDHMFLFPDNISTKSVFDIANVIITVRGTIGLEAACQGIPTILCGESPWSTLEIANVATNPQEYVSMLSNVKSIPRLSNYQILRAKKAAHWYFLRSGSFVGSEIPSFDEKGDFKNTQKFIEFKEFLQSDRSYLYK